MKVAGEAFPARGEDIEQLHADPSFRPTLEQFKLYRDYMRDKPSASIGELASGVADHLGNVFGKGLSAMFSENIAKSPTSLVEGAAQGTVDLGLMIGKPTNPDSYGLRAWEFVFGAGSDEEQHKRHLDALESAEWMHNMREGDETMLLPKDWVNNDIVQMAANVADVSTFVPVAGWAGKAGKLGKLAQRVSSLPEAALKKGASAAASGTGTALRKVAAIPNRMIDAAGEFAQDVTGMTPEGMRTAAVTLGGASLINPVTAKIAGGVAAVKGADYAGQGLQAMGKAINDQPSRLGVFRRLANDATLPRPVSEFSALAASLGGDAALDLGLKGASGAASGMLVGGIVGGLSEGDEGLLAGGMTGAALGGGAGSLARIYDHASGRVMIENQRADYRRWADTIEDADARARTDAYAFKLENYAPGSSALLADADAAARRTGGRIEIVDEAEMKRRVGSQKSSGAYLQDDNVVLLNLERFDKAATAHEVYHNLAKMVAGGEQLDIARQMIFGDAVSDPMFTPDSVRGVLEKYRDVLTGGAREEFNALIGRAFGDDLMVDGENVKIKAQNDLADEIMALHAGYSVFSRSKFKRKPRYNNALMRGGATRTDSIFSWFSTAMRRIFERKQRDMIELATDGNFKDTFNVDGVARVKSPGMDRFMREVMQNTKDVTDEGNAGKTRYQFKKSSPAKWDAMANAGLKSAFVMDGNGKPIRPKTVGEMDANSRAMFTSIEEAMRRNGIDRDAFLQPEDDGTTSFDLNAIRRSLMELPDGEEKFAQLLATMDRFLTQEQRDIIGKLGGSMANDLKQSFNLTYWSATSKKPKSETSVYNTLGVSERGVLPYQFRVSSEGGLYIKALDLSVLSRRLKKSYAANNGKDLFNSPEDAHKQFMEYLRNLTDQDVTLPIEQRTLSEDLEIDGVKLGVEKRNMFYEILGTVPSQRIAPAPDRQGRPGYDPSDPKLINDRVTKSFRIDRMSRLSPTGKSMHFSESTYFGSQANLLPEDVSVETIQKAIDGEVESGTAIPVPIDVGNISYLLDPIDNFDLSSLNGKKAFIMFADRTKVGDYVARDGTRIALHGGPDYPDMNPDITAWAVDGGSIAGQLNKAIEVTDGIAIVVLMKEEAATGNLEFLEVMRHEFKHDAKNKKVGKKRVLAHFNKVLKEMDAAVVKFNEKAAKDNERIDKENIQREKDGKKLLPTIKNKKRIKSGFKTFDDVFDAARDYTFEARGDMIRKFASKEYKKVNGLYWKDVVKGFIDYTGDDGWFAGDVAKVVQFDKGKPVGSPEDFGVAPHPSYKHLVPGRGVANVKGRMHVMDMLKDLINEAADIDEETGVKKRGQMIADDGTIGPQAMSRLQKRSLADTEGRYYFKFDANAYHPRNSNVDIQLKKSAFMGKAEHEAALQRRKQINEQAKRNNTVYLPDEQSKPLTEAEKIKKFASGLSTEEVRSRLAKMRLTPAKHVAQLIGEYPEYLDPVVDYIVQKRKDLVSGKIKPRDVAKAYWMTIASIGADAIDVTTLKAKADQLGIEFDPDPMFLSEGAQGQAQMRPEELAAWWLGTKSGQKALNGIVNGKVDKKAWEIGLSMRDAYGRNDFRDGYTKKGNYKSGGLGKLKDPKKQFNLTNLAALTNAINATRGDSAKLQPLLMKIKGIGEGKKGFIGHLVGMGDAATIDAVELNVWLTGKGETTYASKKMKERAAIGKVASGAKGKREDLFKRIRNRIDHLAKVAPGGDKIPKGVAPHIIHHWLWDAAKETQTTHKGMYHAMANYLPDATRTETQVKPVDLGGAMVTPEPGLISFLPAWHGTPHDVDQFRLNKIGTGEGVQAYGYGLYFAENVKVAEDYRSQLGGKGSEVVFDGGKYLDIKDTLPPEGDTALFMAADFPDVSDYMKWLEKDGRFQDELNWMVRNQDRVELKPKGNLYKVELNLTDDNVLHWDLPFSKQSESVQLAILDGMAREGVTQETYKGILDEVDRLADAANKADDIDGPENKVFNEAYRSQRYRMAQAIDRLMKPQDSFGTPAGVDRYTGNGVYDMLGRPKQSSEFLLKNGVRGIKYADGMSRGARIVGVSPERTYNFVVFDESDIVITERNGERVSVEQASFLPDDADYMRSVESGDMETAQRMVDQAAKSHAVEIKNTFLSQVTDDESFGIRAIDGHKVRIGQVLNQSHNWDDGKKLDTTVGGTSSIGVKATEDSIIRALNILGIHPPGFGKTYGFGFYPAQQVALIKGSNSWEGADLGERIISDATVVDVFNTEPTMRNSQVTRDANGNVIPLSERFNKSSDDIRFLPDDELRMDNDKDVPDEYKETRPGTKARMLNSGRVYSPAVAKMVSDEMKGKAIDRDELDRIIERDIPIRPLSPPMTKRDLPSVDEIKGAVNAKQAKNAYADATEVFNAGDKVTLRQDVPSWNRARVGVVTVRSDDGGVAYVPMIRVDNLNLEPTAGEQNSAARIASGRDKVPTIKATATVSKTQSLPRDLSSWKQVGFNPDRHSYYYLRKGKQKGRPVIGADEAIQVGNTIFVKGNIRYGKREDFRFLPSEERVNIVDANSQRDEVGSSPNVAKRFSPGLTAARAYSSYLDAQRGIPTRN